MLQLQIETMAFDEYMKRLGYKLFSVWECEWERTTSQDKRIKNFLRLLFASLYNSLYNSRLREMTEERAVQKVKDGSFYGLIECDKHVPLELEDKF